MSAALPPDTEPFHEEPLYRTFEELQAWWAALSPSEQALLDLDELVDGLERAGEVWALGDEA